MGSSSTSRTRPRPREWWFATGVWAMASLLSGLPRLAWDETVASLEKELDRLSRRGHGLASEWVTTEDVDARALGPRAGQLRRRAVAAACRAVRSAVDVAGTWVGESGLAYRFDQYGDQVVFEESDGHGVTACGEGLVDGRDVWLRVESADGSEGEAALRLDEGYLAGECLDYESGRSVVVRLRRRRAG